jgi:pyridoxal phosphate enzyme (YggS family)
MHVIRNLLEELLPFGAQLVAVSKFQPLNKIMALYEQGQRDFAENRVQEMLDKAAVLPKDIRWHQIGHLQTNKAKQLAPFVHMIHSVDSLRLLAEINRQAIAQDRVIACLLQFHIAQEETKFGLDEPEARALLESPDYSSFTHVSIQGVMGMATFTEDKALITKEFRALMDIYKRLKSDYFQNDPRFKERSFGMSSDYRIALQEGSTMVRIGSLLFADG